MTLRRNEDKASAVSTLALIIAPIVVLILAMIVAIIDALSLSILAVTQMNALLRRTSATRMQTTRRNADGIRKIWVRSRERKKK